MGKKKATGTVEKKRSKYADDVTGYNLDLSMQSLADVSVADLVLLGRVTSFDFSLNSLTSLADSFCRLTHLVRLDLSSNRLQELPVDFGDLASLKHLNLFKNQLSGLPLSFGALAELRWLDIQGNPLDPQQLPKEVVGTSESDTNDKEKKDCAERVVQHMAKKKLSYERTKARKQKQKDKELEAHLAAQRLEEDRQKEEVRVAKAAAKEARRAEFEAMSRHKHGAVIAKQTEPVPGMNVLPEPAKTGTCQSVFLLACLFGFLAVVAAAFAMFLLPGGGTIKDMDTLTQAILDWMNTLSGTSTLI